MSLTINTIDNYLATSRADASTVVLSSNSRGLHGAGCLQKFKGLFSPRATNDRTLDAIRAAIQNDPTLRQANKDTVDAAFARLRGSRNLLTFSDLKNLMSEVKGRASFDHAVARTAALSEQQDGFSRAELLQGRVTAAVTARFDRELVAGDMTKGEMDALRQAFTKVVHDHVLDTVDDLKDEAAVTRTVDDLMKSGKLDDFFTRLSLPEYRDYRQSVKAALLAEGTVEGLLKTVVRDVLDPKAPTGTAHLDELLTRTCEAFIKEKFENEKGNIESGPFDAIFPKLVRDTIDQIGRPACVEELGDPARKAFNTLALRSTGSVRCGPLS